MLRLIQDVRPQLLKAIVTPVMLLAMSSMVTQADDFQWNVAGPADWNTESNWLNINVPAGPQDRFVNNGGIVTVTANTTLPVRDIVIGRGAGATGRLDNFAGLHSSGPTNWTVVGGDGGTGTYNLANTAATGGTYTGFGLSAGSLTSGSTTTGQLHVGRGAGSVGVLNMNTTGSVSMGNDIFIGENGNGTVNIDAGTFSNGGWTVVGKGATGTGTFRVSGGTYTGPDFFCRGR